MDRLFDETSAALRFPFKNKSLTEAEILNLLSDVDPETEKLQVNHFLKF